MKNEYILSLEKELDSLVDETNFIVEVGPDRIKVLLDRDCGFSTGLKVKVNKTGNYLTVSKRYWVAGKGEETTSLGRYLLNMDKGDHLNTVCDHINRNPLDNRMCNLRVVARYQNSLNRLDDNACGYRNVCYRDKNKPEYGYNVDFTFRGGRLGSKNRFRVSFSYEGHNLVNLAMLADCIMLYYDWDHCNTNFDKVIYNREFIMEYMRLYKIDMMKLDSAINAHKEFDELASF